MQDNQQKQRLIALMVKKLSSTITEEEQLELQYMMDEDPAARSFAEQFDPAFVARELARKDHIDTATEWEKLRQLVLSGNKQTPVRRILVRAAVAASLIILVASALYLMLKKKDEMPAKQIAHTDASHILPPDGKAMLTLDNGESIVLDSLNSQHLALKAQGVIAMNDHELQYGATGASAVVFNTISTPKGSSYKLLLPDGTRVWLNNASSVRFPTAFTGKSREVTTSGEAFFEVAKDNSKPFIVQSKEVKILVLGTSFNLEAWPEKNSVNATLLEGAVRVENKSGAALLKPGQQAKVENNIAVINNTDIDKVIAWKENRFVFRANTIHEVMDQLARYYDLEVAYSGNTTSSLFVGSFMRSAPLSEILEFLEKTGAVHFKIENRKITVLP
ncbi:FecR family protein [Pseudobacter ginsenosidimutans]|uniref:FecR family protein n=1 Tax=Pseudobacter ginsenosidimutans TaxID=661488 RepID=A0A4Q7MDV9_9BACT|nr:FecR family protein [Pseudobacter ginsenosidimutans]QEC42681.1 DUF4974 domain-containing protein [Pseudobacter ginsenosidimutans]RZS65168.1 FecR family protein [Pseudobacter ginsenosidimutans]